MLCARAVRRNVAVIICDGPIGHPATRIERGLAKLILIDLIERRAQLRHPAAACVRAYLNVVATAVQTPVLCV